MPSIRLAHSSWVRARTLAAFKTVEVMPLYMSVPHPLIVKYSPAKVFAGSSGRQTIPTVLEMLTGSKSFKRAKSCI